MHQEEHLSLIKRLGGLAVLFACVFLFNAGIPSPAYAQCDPGLPCVAPLTPNNPYDGVISPNTAGPNADKTMSNACDADFMNQIYNRAFLEAARQNILNEILIRKPDSVIEYSCYDQITSMTAEIAGPMFTETDWYWDREVKIDGQIGEDEVDDVTLNVHMCNGDDPCDKLDKSLEDLVLYALKEYVDENFDHDFGGGSIPGVDYEVKEEIRSDYYLCDFMTITHFMAKCDNIATDDQFFSFEALAGFDPRLLPEQCEDGTDIELENIQVAKNPGFAFAAYDRVNNIYSNLKEPNRCAGSSPIPTGVEVTIDEVSYDWFGNSSVNRRTYDEHICSNPGCSYSYRSNTCQ